MIHSFLHTRKGGGRILGEVWFSEREAERVRSRGFVSLNQTCPKSCFSGSRSSQRRYGNSGPRRIAHVRLFDCSLGSCIMVERTGRNGTWTIYTDGSRLSGIVSQRRNRDTFPPKSSWLFGLVSCRGHDYCSMGIEGEKLARDLFAALRAASKLLEIFLCFSDFFDRRYSIEGIWTRRFEPINPKGWRYLRGSSRGRCWKVEDRDLVGNDLEKGWIRVGNVPTLDARRGQHHRLPWLINTEWLIVRRGYNPRQTNLWRDSRPRAWFLSNLETFFFFPLRSFWS